jgi:hypothetical protein
VTPRLDLGKVIAGAFLVPWWHRKAFARALAIPLALLVAYTVAWYYLAAPYLPQFAMWLVWAMYGLLFTIYAVTCHRLVLLDAESVAKRWRPGWSWRETRFFLWVACIWLILMAGTWVILTVAVNAWMYIAGSHGDGFEFVPHALKIVALYVFGRLCMLFPATALDRNANLRWSWELTRANGWRLLVIVGGLPFALTFLVDLLYRDEATTVEWLIVSVVTFALLAVEIAAISLSYRELTKDEPQLSTTATT